MLGRSNYKILLWLQEKKKRHFRISQGGMVGGKHMIEAFFIFTINTTTAEGPATKTDRKQQEDRSRLVFHIIECERKSKIWRPFPATSNITSIHCGVLKLPDTFSAPTQHTFGIVTVAAIQYINHTDPLGEKWLNKTKQKQNSIFTEN